MSEQVTASEAMLLLCSSDTKKQSQIVQSEVSVMEQKSVMQKESDGEAEQNIIRNITGGLKRMSVEVPGGPKTKVKKTDADDHESLLLGETNELLDELDTDDDDKLLDDGHAESGKIDDKSSSPSSINYEQVEGEGSYSSEEDCGADQFPPEVDNIFEPELSKGAPNQAEAHNSSEYVGHSCFAVPGVFHLKESFRQGGPLNPHRFTSPTPCSFKPGPTCFPSSDKMYSLLLSSISNDSLMIPQGTSLGICVLDFLKVGSSGTAKL